MSLEQALPNIKQFYSSTISDKIGGPIGRKR